MVRAAVLAPKSPETSAVVSKAVARAATLLGIRNGELGRILGLSPSTITRLHQGDWVLEPGRKPYELAVLLVRLYRSLDSITGDDESSRSWLRSPNADLGARPIDLVTTVQGLVDTLAYVDAHRAPL